MLFTGNHAFVNHVYLQNPPNIQVSTTDLNSPAAFGQNLTFLCLQTTPGLSSKEHLQVERCKGGFLLLRVFESWVLERYPTAAI
jgi:hypothetical protein